MASHPSPAPVLPQENIGQVNESHNDLIAIMVSLWFDSGPFLNTVGPPAVSIQASDAWRTSLWHGTTSGDDDDNDDVDVTTIMMMMISHGWFLQQVDYSYRQNGQLGQMGK